MVTRFSTTITVLVLVACSGVVATARASEIVTRNATGVSLKVDADGRALVTFRQGGTLRHVLYWGAVDAKPPTRGAAQVAFKRDFSGGWGSFRKKLWQTMKDACGAYDGPKLPWLVTACKAPDGSYWALQTWQRMLPNLGLAPWKPEQSVWELHISHWTGEPAKLQAYGDWSYSGRFHHLFGTFTYRDQPVYGFRSTNSGSPLDAFGRNVYLDTYDSAYGSGWKRENSFLTHRPNGTFCYGFYPHKPYPGYPAGERPQGHGTQYRITAIGPGVSPDVMWTGGDPGAFDPSDPAKVQLESQMNALQLSLAGPDALCRQK